MLYRTVRNRNESEWVVESFTSALANVELLVLLLFLYVLVNTHRASDQTAEENLVNAQRDVVNKKAVNGEIYQLSLLHNSYEGRFRDFES